MEQLPKIVRDRLEAAQTAAHPDADLLTAFAEHSLGERERVQVLQHLALCRDCRQVVALAAPEPAAALLPTLARPTRKWLAWPVLRWGALAACVVVMSAVGLLYREQRKVTPAKLVAAEQRPAPASPESSLEQKREEPTRSATAPESLRPEAKQQRTPAKVAEPRKNDVFAGAIGPGAGAGIAGKAAANMPAPAMQADELSAQAEAPVANSRVLKNEVEGNATKVPAAAETVEVTAAAAPVQEANAAKQKEQSRAPGIPQQLDSNVAETQAAFARQALAGTAASTSGRALLRDLKSARWTLSDDGLPQRSFDSGKTWEKVQVDHTAGFRALSAQGLEVWVGGPNGALYHSSDLGLHWTRVTPLVAGAPLSADIVKVEFTGPQHGKLTTADNQVLVTSDAGKSWHEQ